MGTIGKYCKAYLLKDFREFSGWTENSAKIRKETQVVDNQSAETTHPLVDDTVFYLQENYVVTDGVYKDENIIFDNVTTEWVEYCKKRLKFEIPAPSPLKDIAK